MDKYEKGKVLGKGTFATVYAATDRKVIGVDQSLNIALVHGIAKLHT
jgi:serine/threonine protein kinase